MSERKTHFPVLKFYTMSSFYLASVVTNLIYKRWRPASGLLIIKDLPLIHSFTKGRKIKPAYSYMSPIFTRYVLDVIN